MIGIGGHLAVPPPPPPPGIRISYHGGSIGLGLDRDYGVGGDRVGIIVSIARPPDEDYLRSRNMRAAYFIVDVTRDRLDRISAMVRRGTLNLPIGEVLDLADAKIGHRMLVLVANSNSNILMMESAQDWYGQDAACFADLTPGSAACGRT
jgi:hypothetical protein